MNTRHPESADWPPSIRAWVDADRHLDLDRMREQLAADVELISPLTDGFTFVGREAVMDVFESAFELLRDIEIAAVTGAGEHWVLRGSNTLNGRNLEELQWLELDRSGSIHRISLFIRPVPAAVTLLSKIGAPLAARGALKKEAGFAARAAAPLAFVLRMTETHIMPRLGRRR